MPMTLQPEEPPAGPWASVGVRDLLDRLLPCPPPPGRPRIVAVDGRSASGKTTLASALHEAVPRSALIHTDDLAWNEPLFAWEHLLRDGVLTPLRQGRAVALRPPAWDAHGRPGLIAVPAGLDAVIVEGVGSGQRAVTPLLDALVWVQSDFRVAERRGIRRDITSGVNGDADEAAAFWHEWMAHESPFLAADRPWERATLIMAGTPTIPLTEGQFAVGDSRPHQLQAARPEDGD